MRRGQQRGSQPEGEKPTSHLLVVQVGEVDAIDFDNLVPWLVEKWRGISMLEELPLEASIRRWVFK